MLGAHGEQRTHKCEHMAGFLLLKVFALVWTGGECNGLFLKRTKAGRDLWNHLTPCPGDRETEAPKDSA